MAQRYQRTEEEIRQQVATARRRRLVTAALSLAVELEDAAFFGATGWREDRLDRVSKAAERVALALECCQRNCTQAELPNDD
jgi:hypothetical protein